MADPRIRFRELPRRFQAFTIILAIVYLGAAIFAIPYSRSTVIAGLAITFAASCLVQPVLSQYGGIRDPSGNLMILAALLWRPPEVLIGVGFGLLLGLPLFRRSEVWRAALNAVGAALPAAIMAEFAYWAKLQVTNSICALFVGAVIGYAIFRIFNQGVCALGRTLRFGSPFLIGWWQNVIAWWSSHLLPVPLIVMLVALALRLGSITWGLVLTAAYLVVLPVPRTRFSPYDESEKIADRIADAIASLLRGTKSNGFGRGNREARSPLKPGPRVWACAFELLKLRYASSRRHSALRSMIRNLQGEENCAVVDSLSMGLPRFRENAPSIEADILTAAEIYDSAGMGISPFDKPHSEEEVICRLFALGKTSVDPDVVATILRVAEEKEDNREPTTFPR